MNISFLTLVLSFKSCWSSKTINAILFFVLINTGNAQNLPDLSNFVVTQPAASVSSFATYLDVPVDNLTGIPNIGYDLMSLPTRSKDVTFNMRLQYHPNNVANHHKASEVGLGWSLFGGGVISVATIGFPDKFANPTNNLYDDQYFYNFMGYSGRFRIIKNSSDGIVKIINLSTNALKFEFVNQNANGLDISSFIITDGKGLKYVFDMIDDVFRPFSDGLYKSYRSGYHLTKVYSSNNALIASLEYDETFVYMHDNIKVESLKKLKKIIAHGYGSIEFVLTTDQIPFLTETRNDRTQIISMSLKNSNGNLIHKCNFTQYYTALQPNYTNPLLVRFLEKFEITDASNTILEKYKFNYSFTDVIGKYEVDNYGFTRVIGDCDINKALFNPLGFGKLTNPATVTHGILKSVELPTGGYINYDFEANKISVYKYALSTHSLRFRDFNNADEFDENKLPYQLDFNNTLDTSTPIDEFEIASNHENFYMELVSQNNFNTTLSNYSQQFNITEDTDLYVTFDGTPWPSQATPVGEEPTIVFQIKKGSTIITPEDYNFAFYECINYKHFKLTPGLHTINILSLAGGNGTYTFHKKKRVVNTRNYYYGGGVRIGKISHYTEAGILEPAKTVKYEYDDFNTPTNSSGQALTVHYMSDFGREIKVFYKHVKVTDGVGNGHTKFYYYTPFDVYDSDHLYYFVVLEQGMLNFSEMFNEQGQLLQKNHFYYDINYNTDLFTYFTNPINGGASFIPPIYKSFIKRSYIKSLDYSYNPTAILVNKKVSIINETNFAPSSTTVFDSNGVRNKTTYHYVQDLPGEPLASTLLAKNMVSIPLKVETYKGAEKLSENKTTYKNWGNNLFAPEILMTAKGTQPLVVRYRTIAIDNTNGNIMESRQEAGMPVTYLYGYNKTLPIARIENATNAQVSAALGIANLTTINESNMPDVNSLRADLPNAMVTTYTHNPFIGVLTITDPKGDSITNEYDNFGRLFRVRDKNGHLITENQYHYKTQN